jgi:hypothetical protein
MSMFFRLAEAGIVLCVGLAAVVKSFIGKEFYTAYLAGSRRGARIPTWLARPLFFLIGVCMIVAAIGWAWSRNG